MKNAIKNQFTLDFSWKTQDPFLVCAFHHDDYPKSNGNFGPATSLAGRNIGADFEIKDGFRMYHGDKVPGFPVHPHRGFETITLVRQGFVDHADSLGSFGRYGHGDVQWMTAGGGIQHSEMFPLLHEDKENTFELFQLWINLPKKNKMVNPEFKMFWSEQIPCVEVDGVVVDVIAGTFNGVKAITPPQYSWAHDEQNEVAVWLITLQPGASIEIPKSSQILNRSLFHFRGGNIKVADQNASAMTGFELDATMSCEIEAESKAEILIIQGRPINEPVSQHGPFVMNSDEEIVKALSDYRKTQFGGWPWDRRDVVHGSDPQRFGKHPNGQKDIPGS